MKLNTTLELSQYTDPLFLFSWNGGEIVEIHSPQTFKDKYLETGVFDESEDYITDYDKNDGDWVNFATAWQRMLEGNFQKWSFDNMEVQRIRTTAEEKAFNDFVRTRTFFPDGSKVKAIDSEYATNPVLVYDECYFIEIVNGNEYYLILDRSEYKSKDLEIIERKLYEWWSTNR